jgi:hypothetical protein
MVFIVVRNKASNYKNSTAVSIAAVLKRECEFIMMTIEKVENAE